MSPPIAVHGTDDEVPPYDGRHPAWWPIPDWAADWAQRNGCAAQSRLIHHPGAVTAETWTDCRASATVVLYTIHGGDHRWPGTANPGLPRLTTGEIDATALIVEFVAGQAGSG